MSEPNEPNVTPTDTLKGTTEPAAKPELVAPKKPVIVARRLNAGDVFTVMRIMATSIGTSNEVKELFKDAFVYDDEGKLKTEDLFSVGVSTAWSVVQGLMTKAYDETIVWLASLAGMNRKEFEELPPTAIVELIEQVVEQDDLTDFFSKCSALLSR